MNLGSVAAALGLEVSAGAVHLDREVRGGCVGDLLSHVMAHGQPGALWVTVQAHPNVVAVATLMDMVGVIVAAGVEPDAAILSRAEANGVPILTTRRSAYGVVAGLVRLGVEEVGEGGGSPLPR